MSRMRVCPAATRREQKLSFCVAALLWVMSFAVLVSLVAWSL